MATSLARSRQHVLDLLKVVPTQFTASSETTDDLLDDMLLREFKHLWARIPPVFRGEFEIAADNTVAVSEELGQVLGVGSRKALLIPEAEWSETLDGVFIHNATDGVSGETVLVWYTTIPAWAYSDEDTPTSEIESSCVLGPDWLEEVAEYGAALQVLLRTSRDAASGGQDRDAVMYRILETTYNAKVAELTAARERFLSRMDARLNARASLGKHIFRESDLPQFANLSRIESRTTGFRSGGE